MLCAVRGECRYRVCLVLDRTGFSAETSGGALGGWVAGDGPPAVLLHGGPGLGFEYMDEVAAELLSSFRVASFQQRGLGPSTCEGPFTIAQAIADIVSVLDELGWDRALIVGHSWGGHLGLRFAAEHPERLLGLLAIEPIGVVGDGGDAAFVAEVKARLPKADREQVEVLLARAEDGDLDELSDQQLSRLLWPAYFADPNHVPPMPDKRLSATVATTLSGEMKSGLEEVRSALSSGQARYGILAGGASPIPWGQAARATVDLSPEAFLRVVPSAGHFLWHESPGSVRDALETLAV